MKTSTLISALVVPTALASPIISRATTSSSSPQCNVKGLDLSMAPSLLSISIQLSSDSCSAACTNNANCNSFGYGLLVCNLYKTTLVSSTSKLSLGLLTFSDKSCAKAAATTPATPATSSKPATPTTTSTPVVNVPLTTLLPSAVPTSVPDVVCQAGATVNKATTGSCGKVTGGTAASELENTGASSVADCALNCVQSGCKSFGFFDGLCSLYSKSVSDLNVGPDLGIYTFYDSSCFTATFCN